MPRRPSPRILQILAIALLAGCSSTSSPTPEPTTPADAPFLLRVSQVQALPPTETFGVRPQVVVTLDGRVLTGGAVPAIFPGPLVVPIIQQQLTPAGWAQVVAAARAAGLLSGASDFTGGRLPPGSAATRLEIVADGRLFHLTGDQGRVMQCITTPCEPQPGSPEAFGGFIGRFFDLPSWLPGQVGAQGQYVPSGFSMLIGAPPDLQGREQPIIAWPLDVDLAKVGKPLADGSGRRCATFVGEAATRLIAPFGAANQLTGWRSPDGSLHGLTVRPLMPGDGDPCEGLV